MMVNPATGERIVFRRTDEWDVAAPPAAVFDARGLAHLPGVVAAGVVSTEPRRPARGREQLDAVNFKGRLPYRLHTTSEIVALERPRRIEAKVDGDLAGLGSGRSRRRRRHPGRFDWRVNADRPLLAT